MNKNNMGQTTISLSANSGLIAKTVYRQTLPRNYLRATFRLPISQDMELYMQIAAYILTHLSKLLWGLLVFFVLYYTYSYFRYPDAFRFWGFYSWIAHGLLVGIWSLVALGVGFGAKKLRKRGLLGMAISKENDKLLQ